MWIPEKKINSVSSRSLWAHFITTAQNRLFPDCDFWLQLKKVKFIEKNKETKWTMKTFSIRAHHRGCYNWLAGSLRYLTDWLSKPLTNSECQPVTRYTSTSCCCDRVFFFFFFTSINSEEWNDWLQSATFLDPDHKVVSSLQRSLRFGMFYWCPTVGKVETATAHGSLHQHSSILYLLWGAGVLLLWGVSEGSIHSDTN